MGDLSGAPITPESRSAGDAPRPSKTVSDHDEAATNSLSLKSSGNQEKAGKVTRNIEIKWRGMSVLVSVVPHPAIAPDTLGFNRVFNDAAKARGYAEGIKASKGWPIADDLGERSKVGAAHNGGQPTVFTEARKGRRWFVSIRNAPWGWGDCRLEFYDEGLAEKYADRLRDRLRLHQVKELARKARQREARQQERERLASGGVR